MNHFKYTLLLMLLTLCSVSALAFEVDGITYAITSSSGSSDNTVKVTSRTGTGKYSGDITIPSNVTYDGVSYRVTSIGSSAFNACTSLRRVALPTTITSIGSSAFYGCSSLTLIEIPSGVTSIESNAFYGCSNLTTIVNKSSLSISAGSSSNGYVGNYATYVVSSISSYNDYKYISYNSKYYIVDYTGSSQSITLPSYLNGYSLSTYYVGKNAFRNNTNLTSVTLPTSVYGIEANAFYGCTNLKSISIGANVASIGSSAFYNCTALESIEYNAKSVSALYSGNNIFYNAGKNSTKGITVNFGSSVTSIPQYLFGGTSSSSYTPNITGVCIPSSVTSIGSSAFYYCSKLKTVINNSSLSLTAGNTGYGYIAYYAKKVYSGGSFSNYSDYRFVYSGGTYYMDSYYGNDSELTLPNGYGSSSYSYIIGKNTFYNNTNLKSVFIPAKVTSIEDNAFYGCTNLKTIFNNSSLVLNIGETTNGYVAYYANNVFKNTNGQIYTSGDFKFLQADGVWNLIGYTGNSTQLILPNDYNGNVYVISGSAFSGNTTIKSVTIPNTITTIGSKAFFNCPNLSSVTIGTNITSIGDYAFYSGSKLSKVYLLPSEVPTGIDKAFSANTYIGSSGYNTNTFVTFVPNSNYTSTKIGTIYVYSNISSKFSVDGVVFVPITASTCDAIDFDYANKPKNLNVNGSITYRNRSLSIENIRDHFMEGNDSLISIKINKSCPIGSYAFSYCINLKSADISTATSIGTNLFEGCIRLEDITLPETITSIPDFTFKGCEFLHSLHIPGTVTRVGRSAFACSYYSEGLRGLEEIDLPNGLTYIDDNAFSCTKITQIDFPLSLTYIGSMAFYGCNKLTEISIPSGITKINNYTFYDCKSLKELTIPANIISIGIGCFHNCTALKNLIIEDSDNVLTITVNSSSSNNYNYWPNINSVYIGRSIAKSTNSYDKSAFQGKTSLKEVVIGNKVKTLIDNAFQDCNNLESVTIGNKLQAISSNMFNGCTKLTSLNLPSTVTSIGSGAFMNCSKLNTFDIPASVTSIGDNAFKGCVLFTRFNIPAGVTTIAKNTFTGCAALNKLTFADSNNALSFECNVSSLPIDSIYVGRNLTYTYSPFKGAQSLKAISFGDKCTSIGDSLVANCSSIKNIYLNKKIVSIGKSAFQNCSLVNKITLPETLTSIGDYALAGCNQIESLNISDNISVLPANVVYGCTALKSFKIPAKVSEVSVSLLSSCSNLQTINIADSSNPLTITGSSALFANTKIDSIYIGRDFTADKAPLYNSKTVRKIVFGNKVKSLQANYFYGCNNLEDMMLPKALTTIGNNAFYGCSKLTKISLPKSVTSVGTNAFDGCSALKYAEIESGQGNLAFNADFDDCALDSIYIGRNLTGNTTPVKGKTSLKSYKTGAYVTSIPENALSGCSTLTDLWIGKAVETLGKNALLNCTSIETIKSFNTTAPVCASGVLSNIDKWGATLYVPTASVSVYESADQWKDFFFIEGMDLVDNIIVTQPTSNSPLVVMSHPNTGEKYQWFVGSSSDALPISGATTSCLTSQQVSVGETVYCEVTLPGGEILRSNSVKITGFATYKTITFMANGAVYFTEMLPAGASITLPEAPIKNGYTFVRWDNMPETMPNNDVVVTAIFKANKYTLTYIVDGEQYKSVETECDAPIIPESAPDKPGKTFVEWNGIVETMPANNLTVTAVYADNVCVIYNGNSTKIEASYNSINEKPVIASADNALVFIDMRLDDNAGSNIVMKNSVDKWQSNSIVLTDAKPFYSPYEIEADIVTYTRDFKADSWQPLYVPYEMSYEDWASYADVAELACVHVYEDGRTTIEFVTVSSDNIRPNTPYMIKPKSLGQITISSLNKTLKPTPADGVNYISCSSPRYEFRLFGNYQPISGSVLATYGDAESGGAYIMAANNKFAHAKSTSTLSAFRLYFTREKNSHGYWNAPARQYMPEPEYLDEIYLMVDGELCGTIDAMYDVDDNSPIFDLLGRPVNFPERGNIYIQNGQKFIKQ